MVMENYIVRPHGTTTPGGFGYAETIGFGEAGTRHYKFNVERFIPAPRNWDVSGQGDRGLVDTLARVESDGRTGIGSLQFSPYAVESLD